MFIYTPRAHPPEMVRAHASSERKLAKWPALFLATTPPTPWGGAGVTARTPSAMSDL
jgi:hypothetical protein